MELAERLATALTRSKEARILAVYRVVTNKGYRSKGYKDRKPTTNEEFIQLVDRLWQIVKKPSSYKATPLRRLYFPKPKGGLRPISIPTYFDRCLQALYKLALDVWAEEKADQHSYGFRPYRNPGWAAKAVWLLRNRKGFKGPYKYVLELDIQKCFDTMSHSWMMENIPFIPRPILQGWLKSGYIELDNLAAGVQETTGIPQGGVISPTIANIVLDGMEKAVYSIDKSARLIRYADDAIVLCDSQELAQSIMKSIQVFLNPRGLIISKDKTKITNISEESFIFVGFRFYDRNGKFYYDIPEAKLAKIKAKVSKVLKTTTDLKSMFIKTNQIIRGFCYAHADANTSAQLRSLGFWLNKRVYTSLFQYYKTKAGQHIIRQVLGDKRKNRKKRSNISKNDISLVIKRIHKQRILRTKGRSNIALVISRRTKGVYKRIPLFNCGHVKIGGGSFVSGKSAYHPDDIPLIQRSANIYLRGIREIALKKTGGKCGLCECILLSGEIPWEVHHVTPRFLKGTLSKKNVLPLCKECHLGVTNAVKSRDIDAIKAYVDQNILGSEVITWASQSIQ